MKKTLKINISGIIFQIDEDAYEKLKKYLDTVGKRFGSSPEGKEIVEDIERRIAELLTERTGNQKDVVTLEDVNHVIEIMGSPEEFAGPELAEEEEAGHDAHAEAEGHLYSRRRNRRLYRDPDNSVLGGICGGLGAYFNIDPVILRVLFVVFVFAWGITAAIYLVLWIIVPPARNAAQKLEMRGERVTIENIERSVKEEYDSVKRNLGRYGSATYTGARTALGEILHVLGVILRAIAKVILLLLGLVLILTGFGLMLAFLTALILHQPFFTEFFSDSNLSLSQLTGLVFSHTDFQWILITLFLVVVLPLVGLIYGGIKLIFRFHARDTWIGLTLFIVWLISAALLASMILVNVKDFSGHSEINSTIQLKNFRNNSIVLDVLPGKLDSVKKNTSYFEKEEIGVYFNAERREYYGKPWLKIERADSTIAYMEVKKGAQGKDRFQASEYASDIQYHWAQNDTALLFDPVFAAPRGKSWRAPHVILKLRIPEGTKVKLTRRTMEILSYAKPDNWDDWNSPHYMQTDMPGRIYLMGKQGLKKLK